MNAAIERVAFASPRLLSQEDQSRADLYALLGRLFYAAPDDKLLQAIVIAEEPQTERRDAPLLEAWRALAAASAVVTHEAVEDEFERLFLGIGRSEVMLFGSYYMAGFLNEKPLVRLREDLAVLGIARNAGVSESEDHIAALCEVMRFLIAGDVATRPAGLAEQQAFFAAHLQSWAAKFCAAVTASEKANFYKRVAAFADAFFAIEIEAFGIDN